MARKIRVSKNKKKSWRKHSEIKDVEEHLDERRIEEITGGPPSEKSNEKLFFVDMKSREAEVPKRIKGRIHWKQRPLRCFQILKSDSHVAQPIKPCPKRIKKDPKRKEAIQEKFVVALARKTGSRFDNDLESNGDILAFDLWGSSEGRTQKEDAATSVLDQELKDYYDEQTKRKGQKVPAFRFERPSLLDPVELPKPGTSYNPEYKAHQSLLLEAHQEELKIEKEKRRLRRSVGNHKVDRRTNEAMWLNEMSQGIMGEEESDNDEGVADGPLSLNPPVRADRRKSAAKKRKEKKRKVVEREARVQKRDAMRSNQIFRIRSLKAEIEAEELRKVERGLRRRQKAQKRALLPAKLGRCRYRNPKIEVNLSEELSENLRTAKMEGNLFLDRLKSLQKRNIIEPRPKSRKLKRRKVKMASYRKKGVETFTT